MSADPIIRDLAGTDFEKEVLGFYVTSNPLSHHAEEINAFSKCNTAELSRYSGEKITIGGMVAKIRNIITKQGRNAGSKMAVFVLEDLQGQVEVVIFPETLSKYSDILVQDAVVFVTGKADFKRETPNIIAEGKSRVFPLSISKGNNKI